MRTVPLEEDVYQYIAAQTKEIGEPASSILRRLLGLPRSNGGTPDVQLPREKEHELVEVLSLPLFRAPTPVVKRMLRILKEVHEQQGTSFSKVLTLQGRNRTYFGTSSHDITKTGKSTQPRQIPGTKYWVLTNSPTPLKQQLLKDALALFGYSEKAVDAAARALQ